MSLCACTTDQRGHRWIALADPGTENMQQHAQSRAGREAELPADKSAWRTDSGQETDRSAAQVAKDLPAGQAPAHHAMGDPAEGAEWSRPASAYRGELVRERPLRLGRLPPPAPPR